MPREGKRSISCPFKWLPLWWDSRPDEATSTSVAVSFPIISHGIRAYYHRFTMGLEGWWIASFPKMEPFSTLSLPCEKYNERSITVYGAHQ